MTFRRIVAAIALTICALTAILTGTAGHGPRPVTRTRTEVVVGVYGPGTWQVTDSETTLAGRVIAHTETETQVR